MASTRQMGCECQCAKISVCCLSLPPFHVLLPRTVPFPLVQQRCPQGVSRGAAPGRKENVQKHIQKEKKGFKKGSKKEKRTRNRRQENLIELDAKRRNPHRRDSNTLTIGTSKHELHKSSVSAASMLLGLSTLQRLATIHENRLSAQRWVERTQGR